MSKSSFEQNLQAMMFRQMQNGELYKQAFEAGITYQANVKMRPVAPQQNHISALGHFDENLPLNPEITANIIQTLSQYGSPATMAQTGGRFFGLVNGGALPVSLAARLLGDFWDQNAALYHISPIAAEIEKIAQNWIVQLLGLPTKSVAGFVSGTSTALLCGLAAARYRLLLNQNYDINAKGLKNAPTLRIVAGRHAHSTVIKAIALMGLGTDNIEWVNVDDEGRLDINDLPELDARTILFLQAGNVNSGAFDPIRQVCVKAQKAGSWVHVDGAFGLWVAASETLKHLTDGIDLAQSWSLDGHKSLNTPYDNGIILCIDEEALTGALQNSGSYIMYSEFRDPMIYTPEMSRRARGIELWAALKFLGKSGVGELMDHLHERAKQFAKGLSKAGFSVLNKIHFNQTLIACNTVEERDNMITHIQKSGDCWVGGSLWFKRPVIRISVSSWATTHKDVDTAIQAFIKARESII